MKLFALIGTRLGHSFSAGYFNGKFLSHGIPAHYEAREMPDLSCLEKWIAGTPDLEGFNVTIPFKEAVIPFLDSLHPLAASVGAVNTVKVTRTADSPRGFTLKGYNTDVSGFLALCTEAGLRPAEADAPSSTALVLGSGGASKAAVSGLKQLGYAPLTVSRSAAKGDMTYEGLTPETVYGACAVVQATPLGMWPNVNYTPSFPYQYLHGSQVCLDLVYNPTETLFMKICRAHGAKTAGGLKMLHAQAEEAWSIWGLPMVEPPAGHAE